MRDRVLYIRVSQPLVESVEKLRQRKSHELGVELSVSELVRMVLREALHERPQPQ